jgi:hypothetical protein
MIATASAASNPGRAQANGHHPRIERSTAYRGGFEEPRQSLSVNRRRRPSPSTCYPPRRLKPQTSPAHTMAINIAEPTLLRRSTGG